MPPARTARTERSSLTATGTGVATSAPVAVSEDRSVRAVLAGGIYNRRELRASLGGKHAFSGRDDAEIAIHLYEERGVQGIKALRGAFAFALWDGRHHRLLLARDQLGVVPLYYTTERGRLAASTSMAALSAMPGVGGAWDAVALDSLLVLGVVPPPATLHPAIRQLHPGELVVWEDAKLRPQRYWTLTFPERRVAGSALGPMLREQLRESLRLRQAGVVAGVLLSGGLDAAALLALTAAEHRPPTRAFIAGPPGAPADEVRAAARLAVRAGLEYVVVADQPDWPATVETLLATHAGAVDALDVGALRVAAARAATDVGAVLAGVGGEEVFGGSPPVRAADRIQRFQRLPGTVREAAEMVARLLPGRRARALGRLVREQRVAPLELYGRHVSLFLPEERAELYTPEAAAALGEAHSWAALTTLFADAVGAGAQETADVLHFVELSLRLPARAATVRAACGELEVLLPLADHRVAQLVASVAPGERGNGRERQLALRAAMAGLVPAPVLRRAHAGSVPGPAAWSAGPLRDLLEEIGRASCRERV